MAASDETKLEKLTAIQGLIAISESLAEQKHLLRSIDSSLKEMAALWRAAAAEHDRETSAASPAPVASPAAVQPTPDSSSKTEKLALAMIGSQLGFDPKVLDGMSEEDAMALLMSKLPKGGAGGAPPPATP